MKKNPGYISMGVTLIVLGLILYFAFQVIKPFVGMIITSAVFAVFVHPLYLLIFKKTGRENLSGVLTVLFSLIFVIIPLGFLSANLVSEAINASNQLQGETDWIHDLQVKITEFVNGFGIPFDATDFDIKSQVLAGVSFFAKSAGSFVVRSGGLVLDLFFTLITIYFLLVEQKRLGKYINDLKLIPERYLTLLRKKAEEMINGTVRGFLLVILMQSVAGISGFTVFGIYAPFLLGFLYGISSLLPLVGGLLVWVPVSLWIYFNQGVFLALTFSLWFIVSSFIIESIIAPKIIGESTKLHQLLVMFSVFGGLQQFGLLGMVLGPTIVALAIVSLGLVRDLSDEKEEIVK